ncbi:MAG: hypothetical protein WD016_02965 [Balneolaceae bacterium]
MKRTKTKKRRYPEGTHPVYDHAFQEAEKSSAILNPDQRNLGNQYLKDHKEAALLELTGDPNHDHYYLQSEEWKIGLIPKFKKDLEELHGRFKNWSKEQMRTGEVPEMPKTWPTPLLELRLKTEAILDVRVKEATVLKRQIKEAEEAKENARRATILENGLLAKMDGKTARDKQELNSIDGQRIAYTEEGLPFLKEPASPYHLMTLYDYKKMAQAWQAEMGLTNEALFKERDELFIKARREAEENGEPIPTVKKGIKDLKKEKISKITKKDFPEWPEEAEAISIT